MGNRTSQNQTETNSRPEQGTRKPREESAADQAKRTLRNYYAIFVSHSWNYDQEYARLIRLLEEADRFSFKNYSVPEDESFEDMSDEELERALREKQIKPSSVVLVPAGVYATHSEWIKREIELAGEEGKPIVGVEPWGKDRTSTEVAQEADIMVGWNTDSIISAIDDLT